MGFVPLWEVWGKSFAPLQAQKKKLTIYEPENKPLNQLASYLGSVSSKNKFWYFEATPSLVFWYSSPIDYLHISIPHLLRLISKPRQLCCLYVLSKQNVHKTDDITPQIRTGDHRKCLSLQAVRSRARHRIGTWSERHLTLHTARPLHSRPHLNLSGPYRQTRWTLSLVPNLTSTAVSFFACHFPQIRSEGLNLLLSSPLLFGVWDLTHQLDQARLLLRPSKTSH